MSGFNFNYSMDSKEIESIVQKARRDFLLRAQSTADSIARQLLDDGKYHTQAKGPAYVLIKDKLDQQILEEDAQKFCEEYIQKHWEQHLTNALSKALMHKANKIAFQAVQDMPTVSAYPNPFRFNGVDENKFPFTCGITKSD